MEELVYQGITIKDFFIYLIGNAMRIHGYLVSSLLEGVAFQLHTMTE